MTQALRHEGDALVQVSSSRLSSFTQLQLSGSTTTGRDASGALVSLASRWEGDAWVVLSRGTGGGVAAALPLETRRWLEPGALTMRFDVTTAAADGSGARVTARRRLHRVSWEPEDVPTPQQAQSGRTVPGTAWSLLFGSAEPDGNDGAEH